ncbi:hydrophobe/Amphiphile Efflux-1 (HAE1) Family [Rubidibacter lacunae KORDI 51-2]|uniref:Hydrophobe/Amphiphile Efflux-1 (HAE1) Family n=1 Tax=Rubidibacter lacunae KORDI 51-2 TaxID=582515 RepID=U5DLK3_9CHRO|nr:efflux RND transporter permease subunit [Rubidibacter lacunae]ERN42551.1 hydrophobe/Amphiphile Efflux-1 (HAE1) Family [Rubidibacter lacunae KORDI 51-2]
MAVFSIAGNFIKRPVLTTVTTLVILLIGGICIPLLPINYVPDIAPIQVQVNALYTGADANTVEDTVTTIVEREISGVQDMDYMTSQSYSGNSSIQVFFPSYTDKDINQVNVQNRVSQSLSSLPEPTQRLGVTVESASTSILRIYGIYSPDERYDAIFLSNYIDANIIDPLKRVRGVGDTRIFGDKFNAMRLWVDPDALASRGLTVPDVTAAVQAQNIVIGAGTIGAEPVPEGQAYEFPLRVRGRFADAAEFEDLVLKTEDDGTLVRLRDVGYAELGAESYTSNGYVNGVPGIGIAIYQAPGSNALDLGRRLEETMDELRANYPPGLGDELVYDTTDFIEVSIKEVVITLLQAIGLVIAVIFVFLQDWRTTVIPAVAIPVALIGALGFAFAFGFSLNSLTLFGLILATGLVVDDAIVIVEAVTTKMETGMTAKEASVEAMGELTGAVISTSLVLMAVFIPVAFFPGTTGALYQQFALILAFAVLVSTFNAISFSPSMSAILLRRKQQGGLMDRIFTPFNRALAWLQSSYKSFVDFLIRVRFLVMIVFGIGIATTYYMFVSVPTGFVPLEDQGILLGIVQAPDGVPLATTDEVLGEVDDFLLELPEVSSTFTASGFSFEGAGSNQGLFFARFEPWSERKDSESSADSVIAKFNRHFSQNQQAIVAAFNPPVIQGFSITGEQELQFQDRSGGRLTIDDLLESAAGVLKAANADPVIGSARTQFTAGTPQLSIELDRTRLQAANVDYQQALSTIGATIGSSYANDFLLGARTYKVYIQAVGDYRNTPEDLKDLNVRSRDGKMIPFGEFATITPITGPPIITHYNGYRAIKLQALPARGSSSGQSIAAMNKAEAEAAIPGTQSEWIGIAKEEIAAGGLAVLIFGFGIIMVFLTLSAQYESYIDPLIILLTVPLALLGALWFVSMRGLVNDVYVNVALVMLIGLASKNAILIVEFANQKREEGLNLIEAAKTAAGSRFRPIIMTAISSLAGFFPLLIASGAGAASRWAIGYALFGGLAVATVLSLLLVPVLYVVIKKIEAAVLGKSDGHESGDDEPPTDPKQSSAVTAFDNGNTSKHPEAPTPGEPTAPQRYEEGENPA